MPTYEYECNKCGLVFEEFLPIDRREEPLDHPQPHPECDVYIAPHAGVAECEIKMKVTAPGFAYDNIKTKHSKMKEPSWFKDRMKDIKKNHPNNTL